MRALETLLASLRADGVLLDVRPAPEHPWVAIQRGTTAVRLGQLDDSYRHGTLAIANQALQPFVEAGRLVRERTVTFTFIYHYDSVDAWLAYMAGDWHTARIPPDLIARAREEFAKETGGVGAGAGELRILRAIAATRYRRAYGK